MSEEANLSTADFDRKRDRVIADFSRASRALTRAHYRGLREMVDMEAETRKDLQKLHSEIDTERNFLVAAYASIEAHTGPDLRQSPLGDAITRINALNGPVGILATTLPLRQDNDGNVLAVGVAAIEHSVVDWTAGAKAWGAQLDALNLWPDGLADDQAHLIEKLKFRVEVFVRTYVGVMERFLDLLDTEELEWFYEDMNVARLWEIERARIILHICRAMTGLTFSTLAELADVAKSTVTRFMATPVPRYVIRDSSLLKIVQATTRQLDDDQGMELELIYGHLLGDHTHDTGDFDTIDDLVDALIGGATIKSEWFTWGAAQAEADRNDTTGVTVRHTRNGPEIVSFEPRRNYSGTPPGRIVNASASANISVTATASATVRHPAINLLGQVAAGVFQEANQWDEGDWEQINLPGNYGINAFGLRVHGDSMDKEFPEGTVLVCVPYNEADDEIPVDRYVIADRTAGDTGFVESTCKKLVENNGTYILMPESTNPAHTPLPLMDMGEQTVRVRAVVTGAIIKF